MNREPRDTSLARARLKLSFVTPATAATEGERTARLLARLCSTDDLATLLGECLRAADSARQELTEAETWAAVVTRARAIHGIRE